MDKWRLANRLRKYWIIVLLLMGLMFIIVGQCINVDNIKNIIVCVGTSLVSASITIFLVKFDIFDMLQNDKMDRFGIYDIFEGRDGVCGYHDDNKGVSFWKKFLESSTDKSIDIVGISMYSFLFTQEIIPVLKNLVCDKNFKIRIVFANPESDEVALQSEEENKTGKLQDNINWLSEKIRSEINHTNLEVYFSKTMPKAFLVRSGTEMIITPYLLNGPFKEPTLWVKNNGYVENTYYKAYTRYIENVISSASKLDLILTEENS